MHHIASQDIDVVVPLCKHHHDAITRWQVAARIQPHDIVGRMILGMALLTEMAARHGIQAIPLVQRIIHFDGDPRIRLDRG